MRQNLIEHLKKVWKPLPYVSGAVFLTLAVIFFSFHIYYAKKIIPGVVLSSGSYLGGRDLRSARDVINSETSVLRASSFVIRFVDPEGVTKTISLKPSDLGVVFDSDKTLTDTYRLGRSGNFLTDVITEVKTALIGKKINVHSYLDEETLSLSFRKLADEIGDPPLDARFVVESGKLSVIPSREGFVLSESDFVAVVKKTIEERSFDVPLVVRSEKPKYSTSDLESVKPILEKRLTRPIIVVSPSEEKSITPEETLLFFAFSKKETGEVELKIDRDALSVYLDNLSREVNVSPRGQLLEVDGLKVVKFQPRVEGKELDKFATANILAEKIGNVDADGKVDLIFKTIPAPETGTNAYGISDLLGEGKTNFTGSILGRIHNLTLASSRLNGLLVPPGETFSFNKAVGEVSSRTGYDQAYIISEGRTVLGTGGGLCQVSSTLFRAVLNSGLPVLKRTAHAYRVHYYEPPVGFDATVYAPSVDFQFKNDTPAHILITNEIKGMDLYFRFYGTPDGRTVEISGPIMKSQSPPPAPLYQEDPTLAKGITRQVDWDAWGASVSVSRIVKRNGEVIQNDTFESRYAPWQAVYIVGTKET